MVLLICILLTVLCFSLSDNGKNGKSRLNNIDSMSISAGPSEFLQLLSVQVSLNTFPFTVSQARPPQHFKWLKLLPFLLALLLACQNPIAFIKGFPINHTEGLFGCLISVCSLCSGAGWIYLVQFIQSAMKESNNLTKGWSLVSVLQDMLSPQWAVRYFQIVKSFACRNIRYALSFGIVRACLYWETG